MTPSPVSAAVRARDTEAAGARVRVVTLARSEKKNALTPAMLGQLHAALLEASASGAGAILLEGEGAAFCSGFDLSLCRENSDALRALLTGLSEVLQSMRACPQPIVLAAHGAAIAGGCALLAAADVVLTHADCKLGYPVVRLGISPAVNAPLLSQSIGAGAARERLLSSQLISGWDALRLGLAHECIEDAGKVRDRALAQALALAAKPAPGMHATKRWLNELDGSMDKGRHLRALDASLGLVGSPEERTRLSELWKAG